MKRTIQFLIPSVLVFVVGYAIFGFSPSAKIESTTDADAHLPTPSAAVEEGLCGKPRDVRGVCPEGDTGEPTSVSVTNNPPTPTVEESPVAQSTIADPVSDIAESPLATPEVEDGSLADAARTKNATTSSIATTDPVEAVVANSDTETPTETPSATSATGEAGENPTRAPSTAPLLAAAARPDLGAAAVRVDASPRTGLACTSAGPITNEAEADRIFRRLTSEGLQTAVRETSRQSQESYIIVTPQAMPVTERKSMTTELKALGVNDFAVVYRGRYRHRISLGVYSQRPLADRRKAELDSLGIDTVLEVRALSRRAWVVDVMAPRQDVAGINDLITDLAPKVPVAKSNCALLAALN
ncbi:MAG: hypothetical protein AAF493_23675 [Pseudomonadota bacterium]